MPIPPCQPQLPPWVATPCCLPQLVPTLAFLFFLKGVAPESGIHRNAKIARGMNPATPFPPSRVRAVQAEVL